MRITMKSDYGLRAMIDLAGHFGQGPVPSSAIAARQQVPEHFLDQVLIALRRAGLLKSQRGPQGGHLLARPPGQITMSDVVFALEGDPTSMACVPHPESCLISAGCGMRDVWVEIERNAQRLLASTTLEQLAQRHKVATQEDEVMYYI